MFPFAIPCKARGIQIKQLNLLFFNCAGKKRPAAERQVVFMVVVLEDTILMIP